MTNFLEIDFNALKTQIHKTAVEKGWWDNATKCFKLKSFICKNILKIGWQLINVL